jgi:hypothetical protein
MKMKFKYEKRHSKKKRKAAAASLEAYTITLITKRSNLECVNS